MVYYPAKRAEGLRDGTLKLLFEEDIRKCWEEYSEQVGMEMATSTRFFIEALNEITDKKPVVVRMMGTNEREGMLMLGRAGVGTYSDMESAAREAIRLSGGSAR